MNTTIKSVIEKTEDMTIRENAAKMMAYGDKRIEVVFTKKNGDERKMVCIPKMNWNEMNGILGVTQQGAKMLATKCLRGMITVAEWLGEGNFVPRTINLGSIKSIKLV